MSRCSTLRSHSLLSLIAAAFLVLPTSATAFEFFDGRLEAHGYFESQLRFISRDFQDTPNMTQWYQVFNLETELDIAPDGYGPFDLFQAYVRAEVRFDCIYVDGCGMWPGGPYGNNPGRLPARLSDAKARLSRGQFLISDSKSTANGANPAAIIFTQDQVLSPNHRVVGWDGMAVTRGLYRVSGADGQTGLPTGVRYNGDGPPLPPQDWPSGRCRVNFMNCTQFAGGSTAFNGEGNYEWTGTTPPTLPSVPLQDFVDLSTFGASPTYTDRTTALAIDDPFPYLIGDAYSDFTFTQINVRGGGNAGLAMSILGPWEPKSIVRPNAMVASRINPFDNFRDPTVSSCPPGNPNCGGFFLLNTDYVDPLTETRPLGYVVNTPIFPAGCDIANPGCAKTPENVGINDPWIYNPNGTPVSSPVLQSAIFNATLNNDKLGRYRSKELEYLKALDFDAASGGPYDGDELNAIAVAFSYAQGSRIGQAKATNGVGSGANPFRPIPIVSAGAEGTNAAVARGNWLPHTNLRSAIENGKVNDYPFNCSESDRMWNRCDSQSQTKELKEAYFDIEMLDSQLWLRIGKQNIVWGKTELFRTTDQFNPVDVSLATLPSLEEARIPLWAFRGVYSLYEIGPLEDVRVELAFNYDEFQPADLGNCGEPYTVNIVCNITFGSALNSLLGIGVAGFNRPPDPWESIKGWEGGARVEWRWDKFSFVVSNFYGFSDFPTINRLVTYERNVDIETGRPLVAGAPRGSGCAAPTGPDNSWYADVNCLRAGPTRRLQLLNDDTNPSFRDSAVMVDATQFSTTNTRYGYAPANNVPYFVDNDAYLADPDDPRNQYADPDNEVYAGDLFRAGAPACGPTSAAGTCVPSLYVPQLDPNNTTGVVAADDEYRDDAIYSTTNALDASPVNQTVFAAVCTATVGFSSLDPSACALNLFSSSNKLPSGPQELSAILGLYLLGDTGVNIVAGPNITGGTAPLVLLWRDQWQLNAPQYIVTDPDTGLPYPAITPETPAGSPFARELQDPEMAGCFNAFASNSPYTGGVGVVTGSGRICDYDDPGFASELKDYYSNDLHSTLNATLTPEQEALLGCGTYFGTNCDQNGIDFLWMDLSAVLQTFPGIEGTSDLAGDGWRTDGLAAGEKAMVTGSLQPCVDDPGNCDIVGGFETVTDIGSPYFGLRADDIPLLFQGWKDNCSTWLGRTDSSRFDGGGAVNGGWNCVKRYGQPGTIGARHIGEGTVERVNTLYSTFVPDADFQNFEMNDAGPRCSTTPFGGTADQVLPGCRRKWASYQGDYLFLENGIGTPMQPRANLNLYGRDRDCMEAADPGSLDDCTFVNNPTLRKGEVLGMYASPRVDPRSWDVTRDGDPDNAGFDNRLLVDLTPSQINFHPAILYRTGHYCAAPDGWNGVTGTSQCDLDNHFGSQRAATMAAAGATAANPLFPGARRGQLYNCFGCPNLPNNVFDPANTLKSIWYSNQCNNDQVLPATGSTFDPRTGQGLPQCAQFQRNFLGGVYANETVRPVYAQGVGHPFTGQPWSNEIAAFSWNFLTLLVAASAEYQDLKIPRRIVEILPKNPFPAFEFPQSYRQPLAYATFDPNDPDNADVIAQIRALEALSPNEDRFDQLQTLRQELNPICSFITTKTCGTVTALMGLAGQGPPVVRAGGNGTYGRRCAIWSCGGQITLDYDKRNVLGFGADFAEDYTKSNWGLEWTWIPDVAYGDSASESMITRVDTFNLTLSVDRPTFINFLNQNRTFFITTQWFFQYIDGYRKSFNTPRGPFNVLGILFIQTGYFQDRLLPKLTLIYDVKSVSSAVVVEFTYRFSDTFSMAFGTAFFMGREFLTDMSVNPLAYGNRCNSDECGGHPYNNSTTPGVGIVRDRDEVFFRLRYTF